MWSDDLRYHQLNDNTELSIASLLTMGIFSSPFNQRFL